MTTPSIATHLEPVAPLDQRLTIPMQSLMTHVLRKANDASSLQIMVVGAARGVGNSFVTRQLAAELGMAFSSVLVVEVTDHQASPAPVASPAPAARGQVAMRMSMSHPACLELFGAGGESQRMKEFQQWLERFSLVLWDVPPPTVTPVALVMTKQVPDFILVAQSERTRRQVAQHVGGQIEHSGGRLMGVVLNRSVNHIPDWAYRLL